MPPISEKGINKKGGLQHASSFKVEVMKEAKAPITDHQNRDVDADADADSDADPRSRSCSRSEERGESCLWSFEPQITGCSYL